MKAAKFNQWFHSIQFGIKVAMFKNQTDFSTHKIKLQMFDIRPPLLQTSLESTSELPIELDDVFTTLDVNVVR